MAIITQKKVEDAVLILFEEKVKELFKTEAISKIGRIKKGEKVTYFVTIQY